MGDVSCATCPFWASFQTDAGVEGKCHHALNALSGDRVNTGHSWWCSNHPLAPGQRDRIAELAMQGLLAGDTEPGGSVTIQATAEIAYNVADAFMAERAKGAK